MSPDSPDAFSRSLSLSCVAQALAEALKSKLPAGLEKFCLGAHVRQVFDTTSPTVHVCSSDDAKANAIRRRNESHGKQTLNHVLDALLSSPAIDGSAGVAACVKVEFREALRDECGHPFDCETKEIQDKLLFDFQGVSNSFTGEKKVFAAHCLQTATESERPRPEDYLCGTTKLCEHIGVAVTPMALDSVWSALIQLGRFSGESNFGCYTVTCLMRGSDPFGFVVGFTLITSTQVEIETLKDCFAFLQQAQASLNKREIALDRLETREDCRAVLALIELFRGMEWRGAKGRIFLPKGIARQLRDDTIGGCVANEHVNFEFKRRDDGILQSIETFIQIASQFCDEKIEGRQLRFGLVHGNPALLFHWDGPSPIPLAVNGAFFAINELPKQFHLIEDPEDRCLVIPYLPPLPLNHTSPRTTIGTPLSSTIGVPAFALELRHFKQAFAESDIIQFWSEEFRPYAYFTARHRWAVACVVGPYSELRMFTAGTLSAYRDGKGWKILRKPESGAGMALHPWERIVEQCPHWKGWPILRVLIELAVQLSPIANRHAKGGMLLFAPLTKDVNQTPAPTDGSNFWFNEKGERVLQDLRAQEPTALPHEALGHWLSGRKLLPDVNEPPDEEVAHRLLRACSQDGAVILSSEHGLVQAFAKRVNPPAIKGDKGSSSGTKRYTAKAFVEMVAKCESIPEASRKLGLAIAVSSDGPITITFVKDVHAEKLEDRLDSITLFEAYEDTQSN